MSKLNGKVAVVTGASKGIGAAIAKALAKEGAAVAVNYRSDKKGADAVAEDIASSGGKAIVVQGDVANSSDVQKLFAEVKKQFGHVDVLVNNAGVYEFGTIDQVTEESYRRLFDTNVLGTLLATQAAAKHFNGNGGSVINVSSVVALTPPANAPVYSATKGAVDVITKSLAQEFGSRRIRVNSLSPGLTETEGVKSMNGGEIQGTDFANSAISRTPLGRVGTPDDIAKAAVFLASDDSQWITGEILPVGGGIRL